METRKIIENGHVEMLIHNGGSIFHDFHQELDDHLESHSYPLEKLLESTDCIKQTSRYLWRWLQDGSIDAPEGSITRLCEEMDIDVLLFTALGCDFWHLFGDTKEWKFLGGLTMHHFSILKLRFIKDNFHYVCMGSAVIHPEIFIKVLADSKPKNFRADVVDFQDMYRPRTRVSKFGTYYQMTHKEYLNKLLRGEIQ